MTAVPRLFGVTLLLGAVAVSCRERPISPLTDAGTATSVAASTTPALSTSPPRLAQDEALLPSLEAPAGQASLSVPGFRDAVVSLPRGATSSRPVLVAVHGNYDRVESFCEIWRGITRGWAFVLCPRGVPRVEAGPKENRWTFGWNGRDLEREVNAGVKALRETYGPHVAPGPLVFAGFSLGAIQGADLVLWRPDLYPRAILVEGGTANWSLAASKAWRKQGGERLLFGCGTAACPPETSVAQNWLELAGVQAKTAYGGHVAHTCDGIVADAVAANLPWLVEGLTAWKGLPPRTNDAGAE